MAGATQATRKALGLQEISSENSALVSKYNSSTGRSQSSHLTVAANLTFLSLSSSRRFSIIIYASSLADALIQKQRLISNSNTHFDLTASFWVVCRLYSVVQFKRGRTTPGIFPA